MVQNTDPFGTTDESLKFTRFFAMCLNNIEEAESVHDPQDTMSFFVRHSVRTTDGSHSRDINFSELVSRALPLQNFRSVSWRSPRAAKEAHIYVLLWGFHMIYFNERQWCLGRISRTREYERLDLTRRFRHFNGEPFVWPAAGWIVRCESGIDCRPTRAFG